MGKTSTTGQEQANPVYSGNFTATGNTVAGVLKGYWNFWIYGVFVGSVTLQASFDGGTTWVNASLDTAGDPATYTTTVKVIGFEPEAGVLYRVVCGAYTSGTINWRLSGGGYGSNEGVPNGWL